MVGQSAAMMQSEHPGTGYWLGAGHSCWLSVSWHLVLVEEMILADGRLFNQGNW